ncbi:MAG TPA: tetratricopeptide repeat protein [Candidatus Eisenbacteria bacterium]
MLRIRQRAARVGTSAAAVVMMVSLLAPTATAGLCFTSGKVYVQQKVYDKAARFLECARKEEPDNLQLYALLAFSRNQLRQYRAAGAAFEIGIQMSTAKKDEKRVKELKQNRDAALVGLYNKGIAAMGRAGTVASLPERTTDEGTPQAKMEKEKGSPGDFANWTEGGARHEVWYYPKESMSYYFAPTGEEPMAVPLKPFTLGGDLQAAVLDSTVFGEYEGGSKMLDALYNFELSALIDPTSADVFKNLSYLYELVGRVDDAIAAARIGLTIKPGDEMLIRNMKVAAMGRGNRLYNAGHYKDATTAYWAAIGADPANQFVYLSRISEAWLQHADPLPKGPERNAAFDSAAVNFKYLFTSAPPDSQAIRENAIFNVAVIATRQENMKDAAAALDEGLKTFPSNLDLLGLAGQVRYQAADYNGSVAALRKAVELNAREPVYHQFLFLSYLKLQKKDESAAEYAMYKALGEGKQRKGSQLKVWVDSADNRLGPGNQAKPTLTAEGYPDEVYTYTEDAKTFESWFYWKKGKSFTFMEGQVFSKGIFPAQTSD